MAEKLLMLALSPTMDKGMIAEWLKKEGDSVASGDVLCEVETDKTTMDYESPFDGTLLKIILEEGSEAAVGDVIGIVGEEGEDISQLLADSNAESAAKSSGSGPQAENLQEEDESDKNSLESEDSENVELTDKTDSDSPSDFIKASPLARKLADINDLKLAAIKGSGPAGRIIKADIEQALSNSSAKKEMADIDEKRSAAGGKAFNRLPEEDLAIPVSGKRKVIAQRLSESKFSAPHYYLKVSVEMDNLLEARQQLNKSSDSKVSINAFLIKLIAEALKKHPGINSSWNTDTIVQHGSIDIGIAVALEDGLITPVVKNCGNKGIIQIDGELSELVSKARSNKLKSEEYSGATFTISNLGSYGIEEFTAIINPPGAAILAIGAIKKSAVVLPDDSFAVRSLMKLSLSCDHRVIDGAVGAEFLTELKMIIEAPIRVLF
jgi:pyruvate dehydrogenase E2 component (dihydrolipoamide acetyltransferase)